MISLISDVGFPAFFLFRVLFGQTIFEKNPMDRIVGYVLAIFMLDYCFEASCARILLLVDASTASKLLLMLISMISRIRSLSASLRLVLGRPNFPGANGSLFFIQYPQTLFTVRMLTFISIAMIRELMLLFLARIM
jgi:hypothetical protein